MARFGDRVKETTDTTGTGTLDLNGAPTGFRGFGDEFTTGNDEISYLIVDDPDNPTEYEYGKGTFTSGTPDTFARDTVEGSSNAGNKVSFTAGTKTIVATPTAEDMNRVLGAGAWGRKSALVREITADTTMVAADDGKLVDADGSGNSPDGLTYTLLPAATAGDGFVVTIKNTGASGTVTIDGNASETIDGATTLSLPAQNDVATLRCDGTGWHVVGRPSEVEIIASGTVSGAAALDLSGLSTTYRAYELVIDGLVPATDAVNLLLRFSNDGGSTFKAGASDYSFVAHDADTGAVAIGLTADETASEIRINNRAVGSDTGEQGSLRLTAFNPANAATRTQVIWQYVYRNSGGTLSVGGGSGEVVTAESNAALRVLFSSGNIEGANYTLYGKRAS